MKKPVIEAVGRPDGLTLRAAGTWDIEAEMPEYGGVRTAVAALGSGDVLGYDTTDLETWDSGFLALVQRLEAIAADRGVEVDHSGLPEGARRLLILHHVHAPLGRRIHERGQQRLCRHHEYDADGAGNKRNDGRHT